MKNRVSLDLEGAGIEPGDEIGLSPLCTATTPAAAKKGGWLASGTLGAPDVVHEANALREARESDENWVAPLPGR